MAPFSATVDVSLMRRRNVAPGHKYVCGFYSLDGLRQYRGDLSQLRYLHLPRDGDLRIGWNLDVGTDAALQRDDERPDPKLDNLLRWLRDPDAPKDLRWKPEIVTNRRTLMILMHTPFEKPNWKITATLFEGSIYLFSTWTNEWPETEANRRRSMWGLKFEEYVTTETFNGDIAVAEDESILDPKFYAIFAYKMQTHHILYGAEIDCVESTCSVENLCDLQKPDTRFVEFKTNKVLRNQNQRTSMQRNKFPKWWEQCFLTNIDKVVCGYRTDSGILTDLEVFTEQDILYNRNVKCSKWSPRVCLNFMDEALSFIKSVILEEDKDAPTGTMWEFEARDQEDHTILLTGRRKTDDGPHADVLLPTWFTSTYVNPGSAHTDDEGPPGQLCAGSDLRGWRAGGLRHAVLVRQPGSLLQHPPRVRHHRQDRGGRGGRPCRLPVPQGRGGGWPRGRWRLLPGLHGQAGHDVRVARGAHGAGRLPGPPLAAPGEGGSQPGRRRRRAPRHRQHALLPQSQDLRLLPDVRRHRGLRQHRGASEDTWPVEHCTLTGHVRYSFVVWQIK